MSDRGDYQITTVSSHELLLHCLKKHLVSAADFELVCILHSVPMVFWLPRFEFDWPAAIRFHDLNLIGQRQFVFAQWRHVTAAEHERGIVRRNEISITRLEISTKR